MPYTRSTGGTRIYYSATGEGPPLLLVHGYTAGAVANFQAFGWVDALKPHFRVYLPDLRGHGRSQKPLRSSAYSLPLLADDVFAVMDDAGLDRAFVAGYSMGSQVVLELLSRHPERFVAAAVGGVGAGWRQGFTNDCKAEAPGRARPLFAWFHGRNTLAFLAWLRINPLALAACWRGIFDGSPPVDASTIGHISTPVLVANAARDGFCHTSARLAAALPASTRLVLPGRNHVTALGDPRLIAAVSSFLLSHRDGPSHPGLALTEGEC